MKILTNRKLEHFANHYDWKKFPNLSCICAIGVTSVTSDRQVKGIQGICAILPPCNFPETERSFVWNRSPLLWDLFCAILTHSPHLSGGHISEQAAQLAPLLSTAKCFSPSARTTCPILLITVQSAFLTHDSTTFLCTCKSSLSLVVCLLLDMISFTCMYQKCHLWDTTSYHTSFAYFLQTCCM